MGYIVYGNNNQAQDVVGDSANTALTDAQKKTIWEWCKYLGKALLKAVIDKLTGAVR